MNFTCKQCAKVFTPLIDRKAMFCSDACRFSFHRNLKRKTPQELRECIICEKEFLNFKTDHLTCSAGCRKQYWLNKQRALPRKKYGHNVLAAREARKIPLTNLQKEVIYGTVLGDGCLNRCSAPFHSLRLGHGEKQLEYLRFKIDILKSLFQQKPTMHRNSNFGYICSPYYRVSSISHPCLTDIYGTFHRGGIRALTYKNLNLLTPTSLLIWYLDDGCFIKRVGSLKICTNRYTLSEVKTIKEWFWKIHRIKTTIQLAKKKTDNGIKTYPNIYVLKDYAPHFLSLLTKSPLYQSIPTCMLYKLNCKEL